MPPPTNIERQKSIWKHEISCVVKHQNPGTAYIGYVYHSMVNNLTTDSKQIGRFVLVFTENLVVTYHTSNLHVEMLML